MTSLILNWHSDVEMKNIFQGFDVKKADMESLFTAMVDDGGVVPVFLNGHPPSALNKNRRGTKRRLGGEPDEEETDGEYDAQLDRFPVGEKNMEIEAHSRELKAILPPPAPSLSALEVRDTQFCTRCLCTGHTALWKDKPDFSARRKEEAEWPVPDASVLSPEQMKEVAYQRVLLRKVCSVLDAITARVARQQLQRRNRGGPSGGGFRERGGSRSGRSRRRHS